MIQLKKIISERNLIFALSFIIITLIFNNFSLVQFEKFIPVQDGLYKSLNNHEFKKQINELLIKDGSYDLDRVCDVTGNMHDRHKVRWVKAFLLKNLFNKLYKANNDLPYYVNIFLHSSLIFFTLIFLNNVFRLEKTHILFFLLYISYVFQQHLGEYSYSIFEMFFLSAAMYASKNKNIFLLTVVSILAVLNRESGVLTALTWLLFNKDYKKIIISYCFILFAFLYANFHFINCIINPKFFIPLEPQRSQVNISDFASINFLSLAKIFFINFIIPFGIIFYNLYKNNSKNIFFLILAIVYLLIFIFATPLHHVSVRLIILPLIMLSFHLSKHKNLNQNL